MKRLVVLEGRASVEAMPVEGEILLGRAREADLRVYDETASRRHARVREDEGRLWIEDLGSANGVHLNGERVEGRAALFPGDRIRIGKVVLAYEGEEVADRPTRVGAPPADAEVEAAVDPDAADPAGRLPGAAARGRWRLLAQGAVAAADAADEREALEGLLDLAVEAFAPDRATVVVLRGRGREDVLAARPKGARPPDSATLRRRVVEDGEAVLVRDTYDAALRREAASMVASRLRSKLAAPLKTAEGVLGFLVLEAEAADRWDADDLDALAAAARQTALAVRNLRALDGARAEVRRLASAAEAGAGVLLGEAPSMQAVRGRIAKAAVVDTPVLVTGATGTGKELVARCLHAEGPRRAAPFVALNCAALVEGLLESEFFGHEKGAFTGATERREGRIREAGAGTLFLDEVGDLPATLQAKLLRVLSEGTFTRVGGTEVLKVACRIVAATNRDLEGLVEEGAFRRDLYFRLAVLEIHLPPLAERGDDVILLAEAGLERIAARLQRPVPRLAQDARDVLCAHAWPGNVRELMNVLERALVLLEGDTVSAADLPVGDRAPAAREGGAPGEVLTFKEAERRALIAALRAAGGRKGKAVELLGTSWPTLNRKIRQHGLEDDGDAS